MEHIATKLDSDVEYAEVRISEQMEFETDNGGALSNGYR